MFRVFVLTIHLGCHVNFVKVAASDTCPQNEEWIEANSTCVCSPGYFKDLSSGTCSACDEGYFKAEAGEDVGRCTDRCAAFYGPRSTSEPGSTSHKDCFCMESSRMIEKPDGSECEACPAEGWACPGGFIIGDDGKRVHHPGNALEVSLATQNTSMGNSMILFFCVLILSSSFKI